MKVHMQENTQQSTPQGHSSLSTCHLSGDQGDRTPEDPKGRQKDNIRVGEADIKLNFPSDVTSSMQPSCIPIVPELPPFLPGERK